jgi:hypothetical protein
VYIFKSLSFYQELEIFEILDSKLWIFDSQPKNFTPSFYEHSIRVLAYLAPYADGCPEFHQIDNPITVF